MCLLHVLSGRYGITIICFVPVERPGTGPVLGTGQGNIPLDVELPTVGAGVGVASGTTEKVAQRE